MIYSLDEESVRKFLLDNGFVIINITIFNQNAMWFGEVKAVFKGKSEQKTTWIIKDLWLKESYVFFSILGLEVLDINYVNESKALDSANLNAEIEKWNVLVNRVKVKEETSEEAHKKLDDLSKNKSLENLKAIGHSTIKWLETTMKQFGSYIDPMMRRDAEKAIWVLQKLLLWSNEDSIRTTLENLIITEDNIKKKVFDSMKHKDNWTVLTNSVVNDLHIIEEITRYNRASAIEEIDGKKDTTDSFYTSFWERGIQMKLLKKDFLNKIKDWNSMSFYAYKWILNLIIVCITGITVYMLTLYLMWKDNSSFLLEILVKLWIAGSLFAIWARFISKESYQRNLLVLWGIVILFIPIYLLIISYFAL